MKETIYTIPINEAFDRHDGCPVCFLSGALERASLEYVMGAAMMEPDVRIETNRLGFCQRHLGKMLAAKNKLSLALMLESHLPELGGAVFPKQGGFSGKDKELAKLCMASKSATSSCYVCARAAGFMGHYYGNILYLWRKEPDFKAKFGRQPFFCLPHYTEMLERAGHSLPKKEQAEFISMLSSICSGYLEGLCSDVSEFCKSFDYRNAGRGLSEGAQAASERAADFINGHYD